MFLDLLRDFSVGYENAPYEIGNFQIGSEKIRGTNEKFPMYNQAGIVAPTNRAFVEFIETYLQAQGGLDGLVS